MRKLIVVAAAIAAASCGGNQGNLSQEQAQSIGDALAAATSDAAVESYNAGAAVGRNQLGASAPKACAEGGTISASLSNVHISCTSGFWSCTYSATETVTASNCTTAAGVNFDGTLTGQLSGTGFNFSVTLSGDLKITGPDGQFVECTDGTITVSGGKVSGTVCGKTLPL